MNDGPFNFAGFTTNIASVARAWEIVERSSPHIISRIKQASTFPAVSLAETHHEGQH